ncbi:class F sortase [Naasia aerilata]|uniref:Class F sortase n=1 Tax=Naasia aerilata TaxID=1162966 RepID=A0ABN6XS25_9MICO|nr:class F sortase [Naasia aerilata]BDZ46697.1 class F sortase [Naasia aerilata]
MRVAVVGLVLLLSGCGAIPPVVPSAPIRSAAPTLAAPAPEPRPTTDVDVQIRSARLEPVTQPVPPVRVQVPAADIDMDIQPVGVRDDGLMELPDYVGTAGWYRFGSDPAEGAGTTVVAAHVDSLKYGLGPFAHLKDLPAGAEIVLTTADGTEHRYSVESVTKVLKEDLPVAEVFTREGPERLVLITCGGQFDYDALRYSDNVLVTAVPAQ